MRHVEEIWKLCFLSAFGDGDKSRAVNPITGCIKQCSSTILHTFGFYLLSMSTYVNKKKIYYQYRRTVASGIYDFGISDNSA